MQPEIMDLFKDLQPPGPSADYESLTQAEKQERKQRLHNIYKRKDGLVKKLWELDVLARSIEPNTEVRCSIRLLGRYYIYNNGGWFPDEQFINCMDHPKPKRYTAVSVAEELESRESRRVQRAEKRLGRRGAREAEQKRALRKARNAIRWGKRIATNLSRGQVDDTDVHDPAVGIGDGGAGSIDSQDSDGGGIEFEDSDNGGVEFEDSDDGGIDFDSNLGAPDVDHFRGEVGDGNGGMATNFDSNLSHPHPAHLSRRLHHVLGVENTHNNDGPEADGSDDDPASYRHPAGRPRQLFQHRPSLAETPPPSSTRPLTPSPSRQARSGRLPHIQTSAKSELYVAIDTYQGRQRKSAHNTPAKDDLSRPQLKAARLPAAGFAHADRMRNHSRHAGSGVQKQPVPRLGSAIDLRTGGDRRAPNTAPVLGGRVQKAAQANRGSQKSARS